MTILLAADCYNDPAKCSQSKLSAALRTPRPNRPENFLRGTGCKRGRAALHQRVTRPVQAVRDVAGQMFDGVRVQRQKTHRFSASPAPFGGRHKKVKSGGQAPK